MMPHAAANPPNKRTIAGTPVFDGDAARAGYALNAMCYSFNRAETGTPSPPTRKHTWLASG